MGAADEVDQAHEEEQQDHGDEGDDQADLIAQPSGAFMLRIALRHRDLWTGSQIAAALVSGPPPVSGQKANF